MMNLDDGPYLFPLKGTTFDFGGETGTAHPTLLPYIQSRASTGSLGSSHSLKRVALCIVVAFSSSLRAEFQGLGMWECQGMYFRQAP